MISTQRAQIDRLGAKAARLEQLEANFARAFYEALGLVDLVQALEAEVECVILDTQAHVSLDTALKVP